MTSTELADYLRYMAEMVERGYFVEGNIDIRSKENGYEVVSAWRTLGNMVAFRDTRPPLCDECGMRHAPGGNTLCSQ